MQEKKDSLNYFGTLRSERVQHEKISILGDLGKKILSKFKRRLLAF